MAAGLSAARGDGFAAAWHAELRHLRRNRWDLAFITVFPLAMVLLLGWLFTAGGMRQLPVAVVDMDRSAASRLLLRMLDASPGIEVVSQPETLDEAFSQVRALDVFAVAWIPRDFSRSARRTEEATVIAYYNASYLAAGQSTMRDIADVVTAFNARLLGGHIGLQLGPAKLRAAPMAVDAAILFNPARSYALFLLPLAFAAVLSLVAALAMTAALGREVRDGTLQGWLGARPWGAIAGKLLPYVLLFSLHGLLATLWVGWAHGGGVAGSVLALAIGQLLLHLAGAGLALLFVGVARDMGTALSLVGLSIGASLAFSSATFPVIGAPLFTRVWSALLPLTAYVKLQMQQLLVGAPLQVSLAPMATLAGIALLAGGVGGWRLAAMRGGASRRAGA